MGERLACRWLCAIPERPDYGYVTLGGVFSGGDGRIIARIDIESNGLVLVITEPGGFIAARAEIGRIGPGGGVRDIEVAVSGAGTQEGKVRVGLGANGPRETVYEDSGFDFRGFSADTALIGARLNTDPRATRELHYDQVAVTESGDVLDRESSEPPEDLPPEEPDVPDGADGEKRLFDPANDSDDAARINQFYDLIAPGQGPVELQLLAEPLPVEAGENTVAVYTRYHVFSGEAGGEQDSRVKLVLKGEGLDSFEPELVEGEGLELDGSTADGWEHLRHILDVPEGYTGLHVYLELADGVYVMQEGVCAPGSLTHAECDDVRMGGIATEGTAEIVRDTYPPAHEAGMEAVGSLVEIGEVRAEGEASVDVTYASSDERDSFGEEYAEPADVPERRYVRIGLAFSGDGEQQAVVPPGEVSVEMRRELATLTRSDRSDFPGVVVVNQLLFPETYPDVDVREVGGRAFPASVTEPIQRIRGVSMSAYTEEAIRELREESARAGAEYTLELPGPMTGGYEHGCVATIRFRKRVELEAEDVPAKVVDGYRRIYATGEAAEVEVLEVAPLSPARQLAEA